MPANPKLTVKQKNPGPQRPAANRKSTGPSADALDGIILPHLFGSKVQFSNQSKIFCDLPDKIPMPLLCRPLRYAEL